MDNLTETFQARVKMHEVLTPTMEQALIGFRYLLNPSLHDTIGEELSTIIVQLQQGTPQERNYARRLTETITNHKLEIGAIVEAIREMDKILDEDSWKRVKEIDSFVTYLVELQDKLIQNAQLDTISKITQMLTTWLSPNAIRDYIATLQSGIQLKNFPDEIQELNDQIYESEKKLRTLDATGESFRMQMRRKFQGLKLKGTDIDLVKPMTLRDENNIEQRNLFRLYKNKMSKEAGVLTSFNPDKVNYLRYVIAQLKKLNLQNVDQPTAVLSQLEDTLTTALSEYTKLLPAGR